MDIEYFGMKHEKNNKTSYLSCNLFFTKVHNSDYVKKFYEYLGILDH